MPSNRQGAGEGLSSGPSMLDLARLRPAPPSAVRELVRVTKPGGSVVWVQLAWRVPVDAARQRLLTGHLGVRPLLLVEWKRLLRDAGVGGLYMEEGAGGGAGPRRPDASRSSPKPGRFETRRTWLPPPGRGAGYAGSPRRWRRSTPA